MPRSDEPVIGFAFFWGLIVFAADDDRRFSAVNMKAELMICARQQFTYRSWVGREYLFEQVEDIEG
jgi:hypothetical protein